MKPVWVLCAVSAVLVSASAPALAGGNANFVFGARAVDTGEDDLSDVEDQGAFGVNVDFRTGDLPFSWVIGFHASGKEDDLSCCGGSGEVTLDLAEVSFGLGWSWEVGNARPYVGGGLTGLSASVELDLPGFDFDKDDQSGAIYGDGGVYWRLGDRFNLGVGGRVVYGTDLEIEGRSFDADYAQVHGVVGWGWD